MLEVFFKAKDEVIWFCDCLFREQKHIDLNWRTDRTWGNRLQFKLDFVDAGGVTGGMIANAMAEVFMQYRLPGMVSDIIRNYYYFTDLDEIERIHELTGWIFNGDERETGVYHSDKEPPAKIVREIFKESICDKEQIHFDSIVKFRMPSIRKSLISYVGLAIDEFKREEDHQTFIETLRDYIAKQEPRMGRIYVLQGESFTFYRESGRAFTRVELRKMMHEEPLYLVGLHANEWNLAPLIAMAPEEVLIYGNDPSEPKTLTVINVFQEKALLRPISSFPFHYSKSEY